MRRVRDAALGGHALLLFRTPRAVRTTATSERDRSRGESRQSSAWPTLSARRGARSRLTSALMVVYATHASPSLGRSPRNRHRMPRLARAAPGPAAGAPVRRRLAPPRRHWRAARDAGGHRAQRADHRRCSRAPTRSRKVHGEPQPGAAWCCWPGARFGGSRRHSARRRHHSRRSSGLAQCPATGCLSPGQASQPPACVPSWSHPTRKLEKEPP